MFRTAEKALNERRRLYYALKGAFALVLLAAVPVLGASKPWPWALFLAGVFVVYRLNTARLLKGYASRTLTLQPQAMEESFSGFTRFVLFEQMEGLRVTQGRDEKILAVEIKTAQGVFVLRGFENMGSLFVALSQRRPAGVLLEVKEVRFDLDRPWPWALVVFVLGAAAALAVLLNLLLG